jgi:hypothetical protein
VAAASEEELVFIAGCTSVAALFYVSFLQELNATNKRSMGKVVFFIL